MQPDLVIRNGAIHDGAGSPPVRADLAVADGRVSRIGQVTAVGADEIDATGLSVAPGFIDIHSHSDYTLLVDPRAASSIHQGVTLEVIGNCGHGCFPVRDPRLSSKIIYGYNGVVPLDWDSPAGYLERLEAARPAVNVVTLVPNGQLRLASVGLTSEPADRQAVAKMKALLEEGLEAGAWGYSTGLEYATEIGAGEQEITELCRVVARAGGLYATHTRNRDAGAVEAVEEAIRTAGRAGVQLQVSHLVPRGGPDDTSRCIELVEQARARGDAVWFDMHTRLYGITFLYAMLPPWVVDEAPARQAEILRDAEARNRIRQHPSIVTGLGDWSRVFLLDNEVRPEFGRLPFTEIGARRDRDPFDAACDILADSVEAEIPPMVIIRSYTEEMQEQVFQHELCVPGSDATALAPDGPLAGSAFMGAYTWAAWFYRFMVREKQVLTPQEAIHKLTGQPAKILGLSGRGLLAEGMAADIAVFDGETLADRGTTFEPSRLATGMRHVVVNGVVTLRDGVATGEHGGRVIRRTG